MTKKEQEEKLRAMDLPKPVTTGSFEVTEEEQKEIDADFGRIIKELQDQNKNT